MSYPLGPPIKEEKPIEPEWKPHPDLPHIQVNAKGQWRNVRPPPPPVPFEWYIGP